MKLNSLIKNKFIKGILTVLFITLMIMIVVSIFKIPGSKIRTTTSKEVNEIEINKKNIENELYKLMEYAYFEGQKDALNGDIRIELKDSSYIWMKSPWDNGKNPLYKPMMSISNGSAISFGNSTTW